MMEPVFIRVAARFNRPSAAADLAGPPAPGHGRSRARVRFERCRRRRLPQKVEGLRLLAELTHQVPGARARVIPPLTKRRARGARRGALARARETTHVLTALLRARRRHVLPVPVLGGHHLGELVAHAERPEPLGGRSLLRPRPALQLPLHDGLLLMHDVTNALRARSARQRYFVENGVVSRVLNSPAVDFSASSSSTAEDDAMLKRDVSRSTLRVGPAEGRAESRRSIASGPTALPRQAQALSGADEG